MVLQSDQLWGSVAESDIYMLKQQYKNNVFVLWKYFLMGIC